MAYQLTEGDGWAVVTATALATIALNPNISNEEADKAWAVALGGGLVDYIETRKGDLDEHPDYLVVQVHYRTPIVEEVE